LEFFLSSFCHPRKIALLYSYASIAIPSPIFRLSPDVRSKVASLLLLLAAAVDKSILCRDVVDLCKEFVSCEAAAAAAAANMAFRSLLKWRWNLVVVQTRNVIRGQRDS
jgi:hypothetical protein